MLKTSKKRPSRIIHAIRPGGKLGWEVTYCGRGVVSSINAAPAGAYRNLDKGLRPACKACDRALQAEGARVQPDEHSVTEPRRLMKAPTDEHQPVEEQEQRRMDPRAVLQHRRLGRGFFGDT
jgi:hypothetical protein